MWEKMCSNELGITPRKSGLFFSPSWDRCTTVSQVQSISLCGKNEKNGSPNVLPTSRWTNDYLAWCKSCLCPSVRKQRWCRWSLAELNRRGRETSHRKDPAVSSWNTNIGVGQTTVLRRQETQTTWLDYLLFRLLDCGLEHITSADK